MTAPPKLPISVCVISGAEQQRIGKALVSVSSWVSEVIVVLNEEVEDGTEDVARQFGAQVFREPWKGHVAQKNSAVAKATAPWLLGLDTDEVIPPALRREITQVFTDATLTARYAAFSMPRCTQFCGRWIRHGDWYPDRKVRLWRKGQGEWGGIDPHDKVVVNGAVGKLRQDLLHFSADTMDRQVAKILPYGEAFAKHYKTLNYTPGYFDLIVRPGWRFVRAYFLRRGFLDGWQGSYIAWMSAFSTATRYAKLLEKRRPLPPSRPEIGEPPPTRPE